MHGRPRVVANLLDQRARLGAGCDVQRLVQHLPAPLKLRQRFAATAGQCIGLDQLLMRILAPRVQFQLALGGPDGGIGLRIHEAPRLAMTEDRPLKAGMIVTVEPGIYLPGWGGVRIEDDVLVTRAGCERLSALPRELSDNTMRA